MICLVVLQDPARRVNVGRVFNFGGGQLSGITGWLGGQTHISRSTLLLGCSADVLAWPAGFTSVGRTLMNLTHVVNDIKPDDVCARACVVVAAHDAK